MARLLLVLAIGILAWTTWRWFQGLNKTQRKRYGVQIIVSAVLLLLVLLVITGRVHWITAIIGGALALAQRFLPTILRSLPFLHQLHRQRSASKQTSGNASQVSTATLAMNLDHESGKISGEVTGGPFAGQSLENLGAEQLLALYRYCEQQDQESCQLLEAYLCQELGNDWRAGQEQQAPTPNAMDAAQARQILGVDEQASEDEIILAHRKLMQKLHPDRGGNDYLAALLNQARDLLLNQV